MSILSYFFTLLWVILNSIVIYTQPIHIAILYGVSCLTATGVGVFVGVGVVGGGGGFSKLVL